MNYTPRTTTIEDATEIIWESIDNTGTSGRLTQKDCEYLAQILNDAGLLAQQRTIPTREIALKKAYRDKASLLHVSDAWAFGEGARAGVDAVLELLADQPATAQIQADVLKDLRDRIDEIEGVMLRVSSDDVTWIHTARSIREWLDEAISRITGEVS